MKFPEIDRVSIFLQFAYDGVDTWLDTFSMTYGAMRAATTNAVNIVTFFLRSLKYSSSVVGFFLGGNPNPFIITVCNSTRGCWRVS